MLKEIQCSFFSHQKITFHQGLNIILGDDDAKNSIGKSTALMVIDFVFGGNSFIKDDAGAIKALGEHHYHFCFLFLGKPYFFSRSTAASDIVHICDENYLKKKEIGLEEYCKTLKTFYGLEALEHSFRSIVSPFARIWKKGAMETDQPFTAALKEPSETALDRLIDLFDQSKYISAAKKTIDEQKSRKSLLVRSMNAEIIPKINKAKFKDNIKSIDENSEKIEQLKNGLGGMLNAYEAMFDEDIRSMQLEKKDYTEKENELRSKIKRLQQEISGITPRLAANISLVAEFFPSVNVDRLAKVEAFHQKIGGVVKKELKEELNVILAEESAISDTIKSLDEKIQRALSSKGVPDDIFERIFSLKEATDKAINENKYFEKKEDLKEVIKISNIKLNEIYAEVFVRIEDKINSKLKSFNKVVYGPARNSSELKIKSPSSYTFKSPDDTGTGKSYAGLIGFDRAMLSLTKIPFLIHDSIVYKNIEVAATKRILKILSAIKSKQVFLSFDESKKFGHKTEKLINRLTVLKLSNSDLLYTKDWRKKK